jgi:hypothetical protein
MKQFVLGAAPVGIGTVIGALSSDNTIAVQPALSLLHLAVNQAMPCDTCPSLKKADGSYMPTMHEYMRAIWTR